MFINWGKQILGSFVGFVREVECMIKVDSRMSVRLWYPEWNRGANFLLEWRYMASKKTMNQISFTNLRLSKPRFCHSLLLVLAFLYYDSFWVSSEKTSVLKQECRLQIRRIIKKWYGYVTYKIKYQDLSSHSPALPIIPTIAGILSSNTSLITCTTTWTRITSIIIH